MRSNSSAQTIAQVLTSADDAAWDALVADSHTANAFLRSGTLAMLEQTDSYGTRIQRVGVRGEDGKLLAGWALPYREHLGFRYSTYFEFFYAGPMLVPSLETGSVHVAKKRLEVLMALALGQRDRLQVIEAEAHPRFTDARAFHYAGFTLQTLYTHVWDFSEPEAVFASMNRERRRLIRRAGEQYRFGPMEGEGVAEDFIRVYRELIRKFDWAPLARWDDDLRNRLGWLMEKGLGEVFGCWDESGSLRGAVILLLSPEDRTVYLWRCGYVPDAGANTVIPGLYWHACQHVFERWGAPMHANFGGSPRLTLTQFKDYLGAVATPHFRLLHDQPGFRTRAWRNLRRRKEDLRRFATRTGVIGLISR